jgi:anti-anti-sigma factor
MRNNEMNEEAVIPENSKAVIQLEGDLVSISLPPLRSKMREMVGAGVRHLTVDLAKVQMVDSAGLGLLMSAHNSLRKTGGAASRDPRIRRHSAPLSDDAFSPAFQCVGELRIKGN